MFTRIFSCFRRSYLQLLVLALPVVIMLISAFREKTRLGENQITTRLQKTVLVELFTSEGCSSCPAADELLPRLREPNVFVLEFHVDYWDRLGWKDPFSDNLFSDRQRGYARRFRLRSLYTPETVINGHSEQVGSDTKAIVSAIAGELGDSGKTDRARLQITAKETTGRIAVAFSASGGKTAGNQESEIVFLALVQPEGSSTIGGGENRGRTLKHINIVRGLKMGKPGDGIIYFDLPAGMSASSLAITGWIQAAENGEIETVTSCKLNS